MNKYPIRIAFNDKLCAHLLRSHAVAVKTNVMHVFVEKRFAHDLLLYVVRMGECKQNTMQSKIKKTTCVRWIFEENEKDRDKLCN